MKFYISQPGVTIVELLVVIAIIAILGVGMFTVGSYVNSQADEKLAKSTIETLVTALEQYYDFYNEFPDPNNDSEYDVSCDFYIERLYYKLTLAPNAKKVLNNLNASLLKNEDNDDFLEIIDPWQEKFYYSYEVGDNFPVITSTGPDMKPNTEDDITSR